MADRFEEYNLFDVRSDWQIPKIKFDYRYFLCRKLILPFLMQSGLDIRRNYGPKVHFESVIKQNKKMGYPTSLYHCRQGGISLNLSRKPRDSSANHLEPGGKKMVCFH
jgi:hypothetical protein